MTRAELIADLDLLPDGALVGVRQAAAYLDFSAEQVKRLFRDRELRGRKGKGVTSPIKFQAGELRRFARGEPIAPRRGNERR